MNKLHFLFKDIPPHFFIIYACILMQMVNWGEGYRFVFHLNLLMVLVSSVYLYKKSSSDVIFTLVFPALFIVLHLLSGAEFVYSGEVRSILFATFFFLGMWLVANKNLDYAVNHLFFATTLILCVYVSSQAIALWWFNQPYGTMTNPHYLAFNSSAALITALYLLKKASYLWAALFSLLVILLGYFILYSSSRPMWIGLIVSGLLLAFLVDARHRTLVVITGALTIGALTVTNLGGFFDRFKSLFDGLASEERVSIWQDTWQMQLGSSPKEWLVGHGLKAFEDDFIAFSVFHSRGLDFNSPHNFILEILYLSGSLGCVLLFLMFFLIYRNLLLAIKNNSEWKNLYLFLTSLLTANLVAVSITVPFFSRYNLTVISFVAGAMLVMRHRQPRIVG